MNNYSTIFMRNPKHPKIQLTQMLTRTEDMYFNLIEVVDTHSFVPLLRLKWSNHMEHLK